MAKWLKLCATSMHTVSTKPDSCHYTTLLNADVPRAKFHVYRDNVSPLRGEKPIFGPLSKNKSGIAALRAGLPVTKKTSHFFVYSRHATHDPHYLAL